jgi:hypothetical protein
MLKRRASYTGEPEKPRKLSYTESSLPFEPGELHAIDPTLNPDDWRYIWEEGNHSDSWWFEHKETEVKVGYGFTHDCDNSWP